MRLVASPARPGVGGLGVRAESRLYSAMPLRSPTSPHALTKRSSKAAFRMGSGARDETARLEGDCQALVRRVGDVAPERRVPGQMRKGAARARRCASSQSTAVPPDEHSTGAGVDARHRKARPWAAKAHSEPHAPQACAASVLWSDACDDQLAGAVAATSRAWPDQS